MEPYLAVPAWWRRSSSRRPSRGYNKELKDYAYNPEQAKSLLRDAGFGQGLKEIAWEDGKREPLQFWYMPVSRRHTSRTPKEIAEAIAADRQVGITVQLQTTDWTVYLGQARRTASSPCKCSGGPGAMVTRITSYATSSAPRGRPVRDSTPTSRSPTSCSRRRR